MTTPVPTPEHSRRGRTARILRWLALGLAAVLLITVAGGVIVYKHLAGNIAHICASCQERIKRPPKLGRAQNILLIGSDTRSFAGGSKFGREVQGARSDTTILVHLSAGGGKAILVSIPRDSYVRIPPCATPGGGTSAPITTKFNTAYSIGGPACTIATVESLTQIHIDHFVEVNFAGFQRMVDALGGVDVCLTRPIDDPIRHVDGHYEGSGLELGAGHHTLEGKQALEFVRARYGVGDGSDLGRIKNQQLFLSSVIRKATSTGLLFDLPALYRFLDAATKSIRTDPGFGLPQLRSLAGKLHGLKPGKVALLTVPLDLNAPGVPAADVAFDPVRAPALWTALRTDGRLPGTQPRRPSPSPSASGGVTLTIPPASISVRVLNGTGQQGLAAHVADQLRAEGFQIAGVGNADSSSYPQTFVRYGPDRNESSQTVAAAVPGSQRQLDGALSTTVELVLGTDATSVVPVTVAGTTAAGPTPAPTASLDVTTADRYTCSSS